MEPKDPAMLTEPLAPPAAPVEPREYAIEARNVGFKYGDFQALHDISLVCAAREITALIGASGCGKSTFLRCLNRMNDMIEGTKVSGTILVEGRDIYQPGVDVAELRRDVGMVFQKPNPFPMSIYDNVAYGPRIHGVRKRNELNEIVQRCLTSAALWEEVKDKLKQSAMSLSGGQQQRLCIARTIAVNPRIILMDEPCSALDPLATASIEDLMMSLKERFSIVVVTHNMQQAQRTSQVTAFFHKGGLIEMNSTRELFIRPQQTLTQNYLQGQFG